MQIIQMCNMQDGQQSYSTMLKKKLQSSSTATQLTSCIWM